MSATSTLPMMLRALKLPAFVAQHEELAAEAERQSWAYTQYLRELVNQEAAGRCQRRIDRHQRQSDLPSEKTLATFDEGKLPLKVRHQLTGLCEGGFVERAHNVLAFGLPGRGKTHIASAIGHALIQRGYRVLFTPAFKLVQRLLVAKRDLVLEKILKRLDVFDVIILDDIGYVQQNRDEMEVLFTFLAERYERRSLIITSNLVFSKWDRIFQDAMTTAAAIDRLVHHSVILEMTGSSYRREIAITEMKGFQQKDLGENNQSESASASTDLPGSDGEK
jgi:DNA replication protein DnaC